MRERRYRWPTGPDSAASRNRSSEAQRQPVALHHHGGLAAADERSEEDRLGQRTLERLLHQARHRPGAERRVVAVLRQPGLGLGRELDGDVLLGELDLQLSDI